MTGVQDGPCDAAIVEGIEVIGKCHCVVPGGVVFIRGLPDEPLPFDHYEWNITDKAIIYQDDQTVITAITKYS
jgi:hypothetical protein